MCEKYINKFLLPPGTWPTTQACALTGNQTGDLLVCRPALNPLSHTSQGDIKTLYDLTYKWNVINKTNKQAKYN